MTIEAENRSEHFPIKCGVSEDHKLFNTDLEEVSIKLNWDHPKWTEICQKRGNTVRLPEWNTAQTSRASKLVTKNGYTIKENWNENHIIYIIYQYTEWTIWRNLSICIS